MVYMAFSTARASVARNDWKVNLALVTSDGVTSIALQTTSNMLVMKG